METPKFDYFYTFIKNCYTQHVGSYHSYPLPYCLIVPITTKAVFTVKKYIPKAPDFVNIQPPIDTFHFLQEMKEDVKKEILFIKSNLVPAEFVVYDAKIELLLKELSELCFHENYNLAFIEKYMNKYNITPEVFATWHDIKDDGNLLYEILETDQSWLNPEAFADGIKEHPNLFQIEFREFQAIQRFFGDFIKDQQVQDLKRYLNNLKISRDDKLSYYPFREQKYFEMFKKYTEQHIIDPFPDYSYLFQRMKKENFIEPIKHKDFMVWLNDGGFISDKWLQNFKDKDTFTALSPKPRPERVNNFDRIFEL